MRCVVPESRKSSSASNAIFNHNLNVFHSTRFLLVLSNSQVSPKVNESMLKFPFAHAWVIHESEDGSKHVFTLLVVEMVRGMLL